MKLRLMLLGLVAVLVAACRHQDPAVGDNPIRFILDEASQSVSGTTKACDASNVIMSSNSNASLTLDVSEQGQLPATKGDVITTETIKELGISAQRSSGSAYFYDVCFSKQSDGYFQSDPPYYWPNDEMLDLYCYYPQSKYFYDAGISLSGSGRSMSVHYNVPGNVYPQVDLSMACVQASPSYTKITLKHTLSRVLFRVGENLPLGTQISSIEIRGFVNSASIMMTGIDSGWSLESSTGSSMVMFNPGNEWTRTENVRTGDIIGSEFFLIPQTISSSNAKIQIYLLEGGSKIRYEFPLNVQWEMGKTYSYYLNIR